MERQRINGEEKFSLTMESYVIEEKFSLAVSRGLRHLPFKVWTLISSQARCQ
jgi:hypothetical protein